MAFYLLKRSCEALPVGTQSSVSLQGRFCPLHFSGSKVHPFDPCGLSGCQLEVHPSNFSLYAPNDEEKVHSFSPHCFRWRSVSSGLVLWKGSSCWEPFLRWLGERFFSLLRVENPSQSARKFSMRESSGLPNPFEAMWSLTLHSGTRWD